MSKFAEFWSRQTDRQTLLNKPSSSSEDPGKDAFVLPPRGHSELMPLNATSNFWSSKLP